MGEGQRGRVGANHELAQSKMSHQTPSNSSNCVMCRQNRYVGSFIETCHANWSRLTHAPEVTCFVWASVVISRLSQGEIPVWVSVGVYVCMLFFSHRDTSLQIKCHVGVGVGVGVLREEGAGRMITWGRWSFLPTRYNLSDGENVKCNIL